MDAITVTFGRGQQVRRGSDGVWRHTDTGQPVPGARDMTLSWLYPDLVIVVDGAGSQVVLVPDVLVRENVDLAWVRDCADGPTDRYDHEASRGHGRTPGWSGVWPVPVAQWDQRNAEPLGVVIDGWTEGMELPR